MRFMHFRAHDKYALHLSKMEKVLPQDVSLENHESYAAFLALVTVHSFLSHKPRMRFLSLNPT